MEKSCSKCKVIKPIEEFYIEKRTGKPKSQCKSCGLAYNKSRTKNKRDVSILIKKCTTCKESKSSNEFSDNYLIKDGISNVCKSCCVIKSNDYVKNNSEKVSEYQKKYNLEHKEDISKYNEDYKLIKRLKNKDYRDKNSSDLIVKFRKNVRNLILDSFKRSLKGSFKKQSKSEDILGCTIDQFMNHIQSLFENGMNFNNHGKCLIGNCEVWNIDHKIPISSAKTEEEIIKLCHYTNLQPLWASDNLTKGKKLINKQI